MVAFAKADINTTKAVNIEWFTTDVTQADTAVGKARQFRIYYTTSLAVAIQYTLDSGSNWVTLETSAINTYRAPIYIPVIDGDLFNMRHVTAATTPTVVCRIDSVLEGA